MSKITRNLKATRHLRQLLLVWLCFALMLLPVFLPVQVQAETTREALAAAKEEQKKLKKQQDNVTYEIRQLSKEAEVLSGDLAWLNERSDEQRALYLEKSLQLEAAISEMEQAYADYIQSEQDLSDKEAQYIKRMQTMFDHQKKSVLQIFLESKSLQGFFTTLQFMNIVADTDQQMIEDLEASRDNAALLRDLAKQHSADMAVVVAQVEADLAKLKADANAKQADLDQTALALSAREQAEDELNAESERIAAEVAELQKQYEAELAAAATAAAKATKAAEATRAVKATKAAEATRAAEAVKSAEATKAAKPTPTPKPAKSESSGGWVWPYPGDYSVYSKYGMRMHPVYHVYRFHSGVDLGGDYGAPIVAAADGVVIQVRNTWQGQNTGGSGYGNYIIISHGDGISTLYAHLKKTLVSVGDSVDAGDKIGLCGSTGTSTGAHLHFEVMVNGKTVNPIPYIT